MKPACQKTVPPSRWLLAQLALPGAALSLLAGCQEPLPVAEPTWAHVEPLLRAHCNHCHGSTAARTGSAGGTVYRFDFYDRDPAVCGEAVEAMSAAAGAGARGWAPLIKASITPKIGGRARMPPAPAEALADWERETIVRWVDQQAARGKPREDNHPPTLQVQTARSPASPDQLDLRAVLQDPDGQAVLGLLRVGGTELKMDRSGSFSTRVDISRWETGAHPVSAVLCDGWTQSRPALPAIQVGDGGVADAAADGGPGDGGDARDALAASDATPDWGARDGGSDGSGADVTLLQDAAPEAPAIMGRCPDLDGNGQLDCDETLLVNSTFDQDLRGWSLEFNASMAHTASDVGGRTAPGAMAITNATAADGEGGSLAGARQCLTVIPGARYRIYAEVLIPSGQDGTDPLRAAGLNVQFWNTADCLGDLVGAFTPPLVGSVPADSWRTTSGATNAPANARSMAVRLVAAKSFRQPAFRALLDNVLVKND